VVGTPDVVIVIDGVRDLEYVEDTVRVGINDCERVTVTEGVRVKGRVVGIELNEMEGVGVNELLCVSDIDIVLVTDIVYEGDIDTVRLRVNVGDCVIVSEFVLVILFVSDTDNVCETLFVYEPESVRVDEGLALDARDTEFVKDLVSVPDVVTDPESVGVNGADVAIGLVETVYVLDTDAIEGVNTPELL
jgi:hypothetical protein